MSLHLDVDVRNLDSTTIECTRNPDHRMMPCRNGVFVCIHCTMMVRITKAFFFDRLEIISPPDGVPA